MSFNGNEGQYVTLQEATVWTANFRNSPNYDNVKSQFYGGVKIKEILKQPGCVGIRVYRALDDRQNPVMVIVGVDANENDMYNGLILEKGILCPPNCGGGGSPLQG